MHRIRPSLVAVALALAPGMLVSAVPTLRIMGGNEDDEYLVKSALGWSETQIPQRRDLELKGAAAILATDRYREVSLQFQGEGPDWVLKVDVQAWKPLSQIVWLGDPPPTLLKKGLQTHLGLGRRMGDRLLAQLQARGHRLLRDSGYPRAQLQWDRREEGSILHLDLRLGNPNRLQSVLIDGEHPYTNQQILDWAKLVPGRTLWNDHTHRQAVSNLRKRLVKDLRFEGQVELAWKDEAKGQLSLSLNAGPRYTIRVKGENFRWIFGRGDLENLLPFWKSERFTPDLLDEGDRRLIQHFEEQGYSQVKCSHTLMMTRPDEVELTYNLNVGMRRYLKRLVFQGCRDISEQALRKAIPLGRGRLGLYSPRLTPMKVREIEARVSQFFTQRGYLDVRVATQIRYLGTSDAELWVRIQEGQPRLLEQLELEISKDLPKESFSLGPILLLYALETVPKGSTEGEGSFFASRMGEEVRLSHQRTQDGSLEFILRPKRPIPLVSNHLARVLGELKQRLTTLGGIYPQIKMAVDQDPQGDTIRLSIPAQGFNHVQRLVLQGAESTRPEVLLREAEMSFGRPIDPDVLAKAQSQVGALGHFRKVDLLSLKDEVSVDSIENPWMEGDLTLKMEEKPPWVYSTAFGYDRARGYHVGLGVQRLNVSGMGRTLDLGIRAGDPTLNIPALRKAFPTGEINRSLDSYTLTYNDPWFLPNTMRKWLNPRVRYQADVAYLQETQATFMARRRRFLQSWEYRLGQYQSIRLGWRWERVETSPSIPGLDPGLLNALAKTPPKIIVSAPYGLWVRDARDNAYDPTEGLFTAVRLEFANQLFGTTKNTSFVKLDFRHQKLWSLGDRASWGVFFAGLRLGIAWPTDARAEELPLSERFFAGGPFSVRGVEPDTLGPIEKFQIANPDPKGQPMETPYLPLGGQGMVVVNLEYRFPLPFSESMWGELFIDAGQIYRRLKRSDDPILMKETQFPPLRITPGLGLILKVGIPVKFEYATDLKRLLGKARSEKEKVTQLKNISISAGFQF